MHFWVGIEDNVGEGNRTEQQLLDPEQGKLFCPSLCSQVFQTTKKGVMDEP
jgi:hypothetical protein